MQGSIGIFLLSYSLRIAIVFCLFFCHASQHVGSSFPDPRGIEHVSLALEAQSSNRWTAREVPKDRYWMN